MEKRKYVVITTEEIFRNYTVEAYDEEEAKYIAESGQVEGEILEHRGETATYCDLQWEDLSDEDRDR
jgi:hypothetical protein